MAAGASRRLGKPKQLLQYKGKSLIQHNVEIASKAQAKEIVVVLGANAAIISTQIDHSNLKVVVNSDWQEGMASSVRCGLHTLLEKMPELDGVILMVCDQPFVTTGLLNDLLLAFKATKKPIITCNYSNTFGPPTLFHKSLFPELLDLKGDVGARKIIQQHINDIAVISFPKGNIDIDTEADYRNIMNSDDKSS